MDIGKKIKKLRIEKLMTQSELTGGEITRNMLSRIENGAALPSLGTVVYLAGKLGVPAGYLLSEGEEEFIYHKTAVMKNIRRAYTGKHFELCRDMCISEFSELDDELELILTDCCLGVAEEAMRAGNLYRACAFLDEAVRHSSCTMYDTTAQHNNVQIMFEMLKFISPALDSDEIDIGMREGSLHSSVFNNIFCKYLSVILNVDRYGDFEREVKAIKSDSLSDYEKLLILHLRARKLIANENFESAIDVLRSVADSEAIIDRFLLYLVSSDMEICCRETDDYKGAYEFSINKLELLEHMLAEE